MNRKAKHPTSKKPAKAALACALGCAAAVEAAGLKTLADLRRPTPNKDTFVYKLVDGRDLTLDVYPVGDRFPTSALPAIVFIHGGGWGTGSSDHFAAHCRYFASRGLVAVNVNYRLTQGYYPDRPAVTVFDCIADVQDAVRWVRTNAARLGVDPRRIAAAGDSAGGHLTAAAGILPDPRTGNVEPAAVPDALILCNPVLDLVSLKWTYGVPGIREKPEADQPEAARRASPLLHLRTGLPPTLILHGTTDACVPVEQARRFQAAMQEKGNRCESVIYEGVAHAFVLLDYYPDEAAVVRAITDIDRFLGSLGYLASPPTLTLSPSSGGANPPGEPH
jgi:acetyl esterase/lipase